MTANHSSRQELSYEAEGTWAEAVNTHATRLQVLGQIDPSGLTQEMIPINPTTARLGEGVFHRRGTRAGNIKFTLEAGGHGGTAAGAITATDLFDLLTHAFGNGDHAENGGLCAAGWTASAGTVDDGSEAFAIGGICRIGTNDPKDAKGNGQAGVVKTFAGNTLTLENALDAAPADNDIVYGMLLNYPETLDEAITGLRFSFATANYRYYLRGCWISDVQLTGLNPGEHPMWEFTVECSDWEAEATTTWPSVTATDAKCGAPVSGGSLFAQALGTSTRLLHSPRELALRLEFNNIPIRGDGGNDRVIIVGCRRGAIRPFLDFSVDAEAATATPYWESWWDTDECTNVRKRVVLTVNAADGRCLAISMPNCKPAQGWNRPTFVDLDGLNRVPVSLEGDTTEVTTNDLTLAGIVIGQG